MRNTEKLYYLDPYLHTAHARITNISQNGTVELDRTIAYPEGGGQESDTGFLLHIPSGNKIRFNYVKRVYGESVEVERGHWVDVSGIILHEIDPEDHDLLTNAVAGDDVEITIDVRRREQLSTSHSASHLLYMGIANVRPDLLSGVIGCHIREGQARFDFRCETKLTVDEVEEIEAIANSLADRNEKISLYASETHPDARYWQCDGYVIPCGGTHLTHTGSIGQMKIKRKNIGKGKERLSCVLLGPSISTAHYKREQF